MLHKHIATVKLLRDIITFSTRYDWLSLKQIFGFYVTYNLHYWIIFFDMIIICSVSKIWRLKLWHSGHADYVRNGIVGRYHIESIVADWLEDARASAPLRKLFREPLTYTVVLEQWISFDNINYLFFVGRVEMRHIDWRDGKFLWDVRIVAVDVVIEGYLLLSIKSLLSFHHSLWLSPLKLLVFFSDNGRWSLILNKWWWIIYGLGQSTEASVNIYSGFVLTSFLFNCSWLNIHHIYIKIYKTPSSSPEQN